MAAEPRHLDAVIALAGRAFRRPLTGRGGELSCAASIASCATKQIPHDEAIRLLIARVLVSPDSCTGSRSPPPGEKAAPVNDWELASRLSYFLWSSMPDRELRSGGRGRPVAASGGARGPGPADVQG